MDLSSDDDVRLWLTDRSPEPLENRCAKVEKLSGAGKLISKLTKETCV
jgi:hypothetical protein